MNRKIIDIYEVLNVINTSVVSKKEKIFYSRILFNKALNNSIMFDTVYRMFLFKIR